MNQVVRQETPNVITVDSSSVLDVIRTMASDPSMDVDKLERLMGLYERMSGSQKKQAFNQAMRAAQADMPQVLRDAKNTQTNSRYARYETISAAIQPIIAKHGFSLSFGEDDSPKENHIRIICDVAHEAGYTKRYHADIPVDNVGMKGNPNKTATHAYGSTKAYGKRYLKCDIFDVAVTNEDNDGNCGAPVESITQDQADKIRDLIEATGTKVDAFCGHFKIEALPDLPVSKYEAAIAALNKKRSAAQ